MLNLSLFLAILLLSTAGANDANHASQLKVKSISETASEYEKLLHGSQSSKHIRSYDEQTEHAKHAEALTQLLFPNAKPSEVPLLSSLKAKQEERKKIKELKASLSQSDLYEYGSERKLLVPCVICRDMDFCSALNGFQIEEVYLPYNLNDLGTCKVLDALGQKVSTEVFGNGRTFRDTPQCKDIVMQYLCLFYGSDNEMYSNQCINQEDVSDSNPVNHKVAPRPPCRSFCVQVAEVCAADPKFMQLCYNIACPPMEDSCTPDPMVEGQVLAANIGCDMPYYINPYFKKNAAKASCGVHGWMGVMTALSAALLVWFS